MLKSIKERLSKFDTIINFSHSDLDGIGCAIVLKNYAIDHEKKFSLKLNSYNNIDSNLKNLVLKPNEILILTDVFPKDTSVLIPFVETKQIIVIDHHESSARFYDEDNMFFNVPSHDKSGDCATMLTWKLFRTNHYMSFLEPLCARIQDYDLWIKKDPGSSKLNILYNFYWEKMVDAFLDGRMEFTEDELAYIAKEEASFNNVYSSLEYFDIDDVPGVPAYFFITQDFINECCEKTFKDYPDIKLCFAFSPRSNTLSVRSVMDNISIGDVLSKLGGGGGHRMAGGWRLTPPFDITDVVSAIKIIMKGVADSI